MKDETTVAGGTMTLTAIKQKKSNMPSEYSCPVGLNKKSKGITKFNPLLKSLKLKCLPSFSPLQRGIRSKKWAESTKIFSVIDEAHLLYQP